jgi:Smg protein
MKTQSNNNIVDVIVYLLENILSKQTEITAEPTEVRESLEDAGFAKETVLCAFAWLRELIEQQNWYDELSSQNINKTIRVFSLDEICKIDLETRNFILSLEHMGILDTKLREIVINQLMQLDSQPVDLFDVKWVVFFVLISKSNKNSKQMHNYILSTMAQKI